MKHLHLPSGLHSGIGLLIDKNWTTQQKLPEKLRDALPVNMMIYLAVGLLVLGVIGRLVAQPTVKAKAKAKGNYSGPKDTPSVFAMK